MVQFLAVHTHDYGPLTGEVLAANKTTETQEVYGAEPLSVEAIVVVAIYKDGTADADDATVLDTTIATRRGIAKALRLSASALNASLGDAHPSDYARTKLTLAQADRSVDASFLNGSLQVAEIAAKNGHEREFLHENAARYEKEAAAFEAYQTFGESNEANNSASHNRVAEGWSRGRPGPLPSLARKGDPRFTQPKTPSQDEAAVHFADIVNVDSL